MDTINNLFKAFTTFSQGNPVVAGLAGMFGLTCLSFVLVKMPQRVWKFLVSQFTTTLSFNNSNVGNGPENFNAFLEWFQANHWTFLVRSYALDGSYGTRLGSTVGAGPGNHFFMWRGYLFRLNRTILTSNPGSYQINMQLTLTMLGRNSKVLMDLIETFRYRPDSTKIGMYTLSGTNGGWNRIADISKRSMDSVVVDEVILADIHKQLKFFLENKAWFEARGLPYKRTFVFYGPPGTGKTSLIKGLASFYDKNLCLVNLAQMSDSGLEHALVTSPAGSFIALEDFDSSDAIHSRVPKPKPKKEESTTVTSTALNEPAPAMSVNMFGGGLTLSGVLNALDGLISLDGKVIFMTTNHLEKMDMALLRKGRVDYTYKLDKLTDTEVRRYVRLMFPEVTETQLAAFGPFADILGCDLQGLYFDHHDSLAAFLDAIPEMHPKAIEEGIGTSSSGLRFEML